MDPAALVEAIVEEVNCPICMTFLREPVSISCGHTFCHSCLSGLWKLSGESQDWGYTCPLCRAPVQPRKLRPNWQLASVVDKVRLLGFCVEMGLKTDVCTLHKEPLTMFCKEDDVVTCKACNQSPAHEAHSVVPVKDVAWEYKTQMEIRKQSILWEFEKYQQLLKEKELPCAQVEEEAAAAQASLEQEERETLNKLELRHEKIIQQSQVLWRMIVELEERSQRPVRWMVQGIQEALNSPIPPITKNSVFIRVPTPSNTPPCLASVLIPESFFLVDVRLDPDTAYSRLVVSKDRKSVHYGDTQQNLPDNPERFYRYNIVLGSQCISSGRHYWEVEVGNRSEWGLGVCMENVDRKEVVYLSPHYGFWVIRLRKGTEYRAGTDEYPLLPLSVPPHRVGIFLDYEAHDISFYNVTDDGSHIFTFPHYPFPGRLLPYFSPCYSIATNNTTPLTICSLVGED
ncbi:Tripartite motif-containing protein 68 [Cricetulus griseus]|nr:Tripartite motif-containing protein 68 [Cricetulus griseus]